MEEDGPRDITVPGGYVDQEDVSNDLHAVHSSIHLDAAPGGALFVPATVVLDDPASGNVVVTSAPPVFSGFAATTTTTTGMGETGAGLTATTGHGMTRELATSGFAVGFSHDRFDEEEEGDILVTGRHVDQEGGSDHLRALQTAESQCDRTPLLNDDVIHEIFLRISSHAPWTLARMPAVCKWWHRKLSGRDLHVLYRDRHRSSPPMLGFFYAHKFVLTGYHRYKTTRFNMPIPATFDTSFIKAPYSPRLPDRPGWDVCDARHGRLLLMASGLLSVWSPISGGARTMALPALWDYCCVSWQAAVVCTTEGCHHVQCHDGPFRVVMVATPRGSWGGMSGAAVYSSEEDSWSESASIQDLGAALALGGEPSVLLESTLYFPCQGGRTVVEYKMTSGELQVINSPPNTHTSAVRSVLLATDGKLGFAVIQGLYNLLVWSRTDGEWILYKSFSLRPIPELQNLSLYKSSPVGSAVISGVSTVLILAEDGVFAIDLISRVVRKLTTRTNLDHAFPFLSFYPTAEGEEHHH